MNDPKDPKQAMAVSLQESTAYSATDGLLVLRCGRQHTDCTQAKRKTIPNCRLEDGYQNSWVKQHAVYCNITSSYAIYSSTNDWTISAASNDWRICDVRVHKSSGGD